MNEDNTADAVAAPDTPESSAPYLSMIEDAQKVFQPWNDKCDNIAKQYADLKRLTGDERSREMQIFWANIQVLRRVIYARSPVPEVVSRFKDRKPIIRKTSEVMERCLSASFDLQDIHTVLKAVRDELVLFGRGCSPWVRYETKDKPKVDAQPNKGASSYDEYVCYDHVSRKDFLHEPARKWTEVGWVARKVWLTGRQGSERFGDRWTGVEYTTTENDTEDGYSVEKKACVWEIWDKTRGLIVWVTKGKEDVLDIQEPHLQLEGFFPCAPPALGTCEPESLIPVPDFAFYKDQVEEINIATNRISALSEALRLKGFYSAGGEDISDAIERAMQDQSDNALLVPVPSTAAMGSGGIANAIMWMPLNEVIQTISALVQERRNLIDDVYQITGISDIMRGDTNASETATAQNIKAQYGNVRVAERQDEMIRIADQTERIAAEIMAENFKIETLQGMSQVDDIPTAQAAQDTYQQQVNQQIAQVPPEQQQQALQSIRQQAEQTLQSTVTWEAIQQLLRDQRARPFVFQVATDSTIQPNEDQEKQRRTEYITSVGGFLQQAAPLVQNAPQLAPLVAEMLQFVTGAYRTGRQLEGTIDEVAEQMQQMAKQPQQPDPAAEAAKKAEAQKTQAEQQRMAFEDQKQQFEMKMAQIEAGFKERELAIAERIKQIGLQIAEMKLAESQSRPLERVNGNA